MPTIGAFVISREHLVALDKSVRWQDSFLGVGKIFIVDFGEIKAEAVVKTVAKRYAARKSKISEQRGLPSWPKARDLRSRLAGVRGFESRTPHHWYRISSFSTFLCKRCYLLSRRLWCSSLLDLIHTTSTLKLALNMANASLFLSAKDRRCNKLWKREQHLKWCCYWQPLCW